MFPVSNVEEITGAEGEDLLNISAPAPSVVHVHEDLLEHGSEEVSCQTCQPQANTTATELLPTSTRQEPPAVVEAMLNEASYMDSYEAVFDEFIAENPDIFSIMRRQDWKVNLEPVLLNFEKSRHDQHPYLHALSDKRDKWREWLIYQLCHECLRRVLLLGMNVSVMSPSATMSFHAYATYRTMFPGTPDTEIVQVLDTMASQDALRRTRSSFPLESA